MKIFSNRDSETRRNLMCWKEKSPVENTWLDRSDLQQIGLVVLKCYESLSIPNSTGRVLSHRGE